MGGSGEGYVLFFFFLLQVVWLFSGDDEGLLFINLKFSLYFKSISPYQLNVKRKREDQIQKLC